MMNSTIETEPQKTIVKIMVSEESNDKVFDFFEDAKNLEIGGAISNVVKEMDEWYSFNHKVAGNARLKISSKNRELGILDHLFEGGGLSWTVYVRIINNGYGSTTSWTFLKPNGLADKQFEEQLKGFDVEIENWNKHLSSIRH
ncbi:MAG: hypothetical protein L0H55_05445 [Candidatus Nitrosocosmicus sp.]|nr:hypothetical protein [Candidatus Nitrosocosmicus sp.]